MPKWMQMPTWTGTSNDSKAGLCLASFHKGERAAVRDLGLDCVWFILEHVYVSIRFIG
jgi:hypothetical protein